MTDLSIIILTRNNLKILDECLSSVYMHTKGISFEVIVTDNGSSDGTQALIKNKYGNVVLIENGKNVGFTVANNKGIMIAKGRYCLLLNDDTYITEDPFSQMVKHMDSDEKIGIFGPKLLNPDGSIQHQGSIFTYFRWRSSAPTDVPMVIGAALMIRMSLVEKIGLMDENLFFYNDDLDLCLRAKKAGYRVVYYPQASVYHYGGFSSKGGINIPLMIEGYRGGLYFCNKYYGPVAYNIYRVLLLSYVLVALLYSWIFSFWNRKRFELYNEVLGMILSKQILSK